jgi:hypothetical protein
LTDADILEVLVNVVLNIFTNYTTHIAATEIYFPVVELKKAAWARIVIPFLFH